MVVWIKIKICPQFIMSRAINSGKQSRNLHQSSGPYHFIWKEVLTPPHSYDLKGIISALYSGGNDFEYNTPSGLRPALTSGNIHCSK